MLKKGVFLTAMVCFLMAPATAGAATTLGPENPNPDPGNTQAINWPSGSLLFTELAPPGVQLIAPFGGVVTSWRLYTDDTYPESAVQLRTLAPLGPKTYAVTGGDKVQPLPVISATGALTHNVLHIFSARMPIAAGELVGVSLLKAASGSAIVPVLPVGEGWQYGCVNGSCGAGGQEGAPWTAAHSAEQWLAMNATLEPDVDLDGLGDESQDACVGACLPSPAPTPTPAPTTQK